MLIATIRAEECIGCARCLPACPVDAILGAQKFLHTVLSDECIGCELCVAPCPMNCIEMIEKPIELDISNPTHSKHHSMNEKNTDRIARANKAKQRYIAKRQRFLQKQKPLLTDANQDPAVKENIRQEIKLAIARVEAKKNERKDNS